MNEVRLDRHMHRMHSDFHRKMICLARVARTARGHDVGPLIGSTARERNQVITRQRFARLELDLQSPAILAAIAIARKKECVGDLPAEATRNVNEPHEANDRRARQSQSLGTDYPSGIRLDDFSFSI